MTSDIEVELHKEFICVCQPEGKEKADALMEWMFDELSFVSGDYEFKANADNWLSAFCFHINDTYLARVTGIVSDMWHVVRAETYDGTFKTSVQCDMVEHGFAATLRAFKDHGVPNYDSDKD